MPEYARKPVRADRLSHENQHVANRTIEQALEHSNNKRVSTDSKSSLPPEWSEPDLDAKKGPTPPGLSTYSPIKGPPKNTGLSRHEFFAEYSTKYDQAGRREAMKDHQLSQNDRDFADQDQDRTFDNTPLRSYAPVPFNPTANPLYGQPEQEEVAESSEMVSESGHVSVFVGAGDPPSPPNDSDPVAQKVAENEQLPQSESTKEFEFTPEQAALIDAYRLRDMVLQLPEAERPAFAAFLIEFDAKQTTLNIGEERREQFLKINSQSLRIIQETLADGSVRHLAEYNNSPDQYIIERINSPGDIAAPELVELSAGDPAEFTNVPGKGTLRVLEDELTTPGHSTQLGVENDSPTIDPHVYYSRKIEVNSTDGRRIGVNIYGRTNLTGPMDGTPSLDTAGDSYLKVEFLVSDGEGATEYARYEAVGNSIAEASPNCAASGGFAEILLQRDGSDAALLDGILTKANKMLAPLAPEPSSDPVEIIGTGGGINSAPDPRLKGEGHDKASEGPQVHLAPSKAGKRKAWGKLTSSEKQQEAWAEFKKEFSWKNVGQNILIGLGVIVLIMAAVKLPAIGAIAIPLLGVAAIAMGIMTVLGPLLAGKNPIVSEWLKGGLLAVGGLCLLATAILAAPELIAAATFGALASGIMYLVVEVIEAHLTFKNAIKAKTRAEMKAKAKESAHQAEQSVTDGVLAMLPISRIRKVVGRLERYKARPGAPGEEGIPPPSEDEVRTRSEKTKKTDESARESELANELESVQYTTETGQAINSKFWKPAKIIKGRRVYQRDDLFDPRFVDDEGVSNLQKMRIGNAPTGIDGDPVNIHHLIHIEPGAVAEVGGKFHQQHTKILHFQESGKSFRTHDGRRSTWPRSRSGKVKRTKKDQAFNLWKKKYWKQRSKDFNN